MTTLTFQTTTLSVINQNNQTWLSVTDIAKALGYKETNGVIRLYNAHSDEFTPYMTALIDMQTAGGVQKVRIFSLRGCHLIGMLSHTKVAKDFRKWVLDILDKEVSQNNQRNLPLAVEQDEEALHIIVNLFHSLNGAYDMGEKLRTQAPHLARQIDNEVGGHYIYNLHMPTKQALEKAHKFVHAKSERIMFVKGMLSLLEEPKQLVHTNF